MAPFQDAAFHAFPSCVHAPGSCVNLRTWLDRARAAMWSDVPRVAQLAVVLDSRNCALLPDLTPDYHRILNPMQLWPHKDAW
jgi:hypothetical protein